MADARIIRRTPDWVKPQSQPADRVVDSDVEFCRPLSEIHFDLAHRTERTVAPDVETL